MILVFGKTGQVATELGAGPRRYREMVRLVQRRAAPLRTWHLDPG